MKDSWFAFAQTEEQATLLVTYCEDLPLFKCDLDELLIMTREQRFEIYQEHIKIARTMKNEAKNFAMLFPGLVEGIIGNRSV